METLKLVFDAAGQILVVCLLLGAGLPGLFALGVRISAGSQVTSADGTAAAAPGVASRALASLCFLVVLFGVVIGIVVIVGAGFGLMVSFESGFPTLGPQT